MDWNRYQQGWVFPPAYCLNNSLDETTQCIGQEYSCFDTLFPADNAGDDQAWSNSNGVRPWLSKFPYRMFNLAHRMARSLQVVCPIPAADQVQFMMKGVYLQVVLYYPLPNTWLAR